MMFLFGISLKYYLVKGVPLTVIILYKKEKTSRDIPSSLKAGYPARREEIWKRYSNIEKHLERREGVA